MPAPIADDPASWSWPEDVRERMAAERREINANREADAEAQGNLRAVWDDMAKAWRARACEATKDEPQEPDLHDYIGWPSV